MQVVALDFETYLATDNAAPKPVCLSYCGDDKLGKGVVAGNDMRSKLQYFLNRVEEDFEYHLVFQNAKFDLLVIHEHFPELRPQLYNALQYNQVHDTLIREKLYDLSTEGRIKRRGYSLSDLSRKYLAKDLSHLKKGEDVWRLWYCLLDGIPVEHWSGQTFTTPKGHLLDGQEAYDYALSDTENTLKVFWEQEKIRQNEGTGSMNTEELQVKADFCLGLWSMSGLRVDRMAVQALLDEVESKIEPIRQQLIDLGFAKRIFKDEERTKKMIDTLRQKHADGKVTEEEFEAKYPAYVERLNRYKKINEQGGTFTKNNKKFIEYLEKNYKEFNTYGPRTATGKKNLRVDSDALEDYPYDDVISARQELALWEKYRQTYLPALLGKDRAHFRYDVLKETGRTSGFVQVMPREGGVRECFLPDENELLVACDYSALELCSVAQTMRDIFGRSRMLALLNSGDKPTDIHAIMGAYLFASDFNQDPDVEMFKELKQSDPETFKLYRTRGKPVGLGFFGGLGEETMSKVAKAQGVTIDKEYALNARRVHAQLFPEVVDYLGYNHKRDDLMLAIKGGGWLETAATQFSKTQYGWQPIRYAYSVNGRYRANCTFCSCANGRSMQSPSADGAKEAIFLITRACYDESQGSLLYGSKPKAFIHDEIIVSVGGSLEEQKEKADEIGRLMQIGMQRILYDVRITTEAGLMDRWTKDEEKHLWTSLTWSEPGQGGQDALYKKQGQNTSNS